MKTFLTSNKKRITLILSILTILNIATIKIFDKPLKNEICKNGIISFELAKDLDKSVKIINSWDANAKINMALSLGFDFLFLVIYSSFIALLIFNINIKLWKNKPFYKVGQFLIATIFLAAIFDIIENIALIKLLLGDLQQIWSSTAYYFAIVKFLIVLICIVYLLINWFILLFKK
jgi:hypothetical protein